MNAAAAVGSGSAATIGADTRDALAELLLSMADDEFIIGYWDSEWTGIAPMLEEDVAFSSIAQDEIGHARVLYELLADLTDGDADRIAYGREPDEYRHASLLNHARGDWAFSIARRWLYDTADAVRLEALTASTYTPLAQVVAKIRREETYHLMHMDAWIRRLAAAEEPARGRLVQALEALWADAATVFTQLAGEPVLLREGILGQPLHEQRGRWAEGVTATLGEIGIRMPSAVAPDDAGRSTRTDDFAWLWGQFTMVARSEEGATW